MRCAQMWLDGWLLLVYPSRPTNSIGCSEDTRSSSSCTNPVSKNTFDKYLLNENTSAEVVKVYHTAQTFQPYLPPKKGEVWKVSLLRLGWESTHLCVADGTWSPQGATLWTCLWGINWGRRITLDTGMQVSPLHVPKSCRKGAEEQPSCLSWLHMHVPSRLELCYHDSHQHGLHPKLWAE